MENQDKKKTKRNLKISKKHIIFLLVTIGIVLLAYNLAKTLSVFDIDNVNVEGNKLLDDERVLLYSGIAIGENIFELDKEEIRMNLKSESYVKDVEISRKLPNKVNISIQEETDIFVIDNREKIYISVGGKVLDKEEALKGYFVPILKGLNIGKTTISKDLEYENKIDREQFLSFLKGMSESEIHDRLNNAIISEKNEIVLNLNAGETVFLGDFSEMDYKFQYLSDILDDLEKKDKFFEKIDFTRGKRVVVEEKIFREEE